MEIRRMLVEMTAEAQAVRDAFAYGTVLVDGREYRMREDWWVVADRAAAKFGNTS
jgi:hypothetical protein